MSDLLRFLGFIFLVCFVGAGVYILYNYWQVEEVVDYYYYTETVTKANWVAIGTSIGLILQGLISSCAASCIATCVDNTRDIKQMLKKDDETEDEPKTEEEKAREKIPSYRRDL